MAEAVFSFLGLALARLVEGLNRILVSLAESSVSPGYLWDDARGPPGGLRSVTEIVNYQRLINVAGHESCLLCTGCVWLRRRALGSAARLKRQVSAYE